MAESSIRTRMRSRWRCAAESLSSCAALRKGKSPTAFSTRSCGYGSRCRRRADMDQESLRQYLGFYQDLGVGTLYRRSKMQQRTQTPMTPLPGLAPKNDTLLKILEDIGDCKRCRLHIGRHKIVFGSGNEQAPLVVVREGPCGDEDIQ